MPLSRSKVPNVFLANFLILIALGVILVSENSLLIVTVAIASFLIFMLHINKPEFSLYLFLFLLPWIPYVSVGTFKIWPIVGAVVIFSYLVWILMAGLKIRHMEGCLKYFLVFYGILFISFLVNGPYPRTGYVFRQYFELLALFFLITQIMNNFIHIKNLIWVMILMQCCNAATLWLQHFAIISQFYFFDVDLGNRLGGNFGNPNVAAFNLNCALPLIMFLFYEHKANFKIRTTLIILFVFIIVAIVFTISLTGMIGLTVAIFASIYFINPRMNKPRLRYLIIAFCFGLGTFFVLFSLPQYRTRIEMKISKFDNEDLVNQSRIGRWIGSARVIAENPMFGTGPGSSKAAMTRMTGYIGGPHSTFLYVGLEGGLPGMGFFILFFGKPLRKLWRRYKKYRYTYVNREIMLLYGTSIALFCVIFVGSLIRSAQRDIIVWISLGLVISLLRIDRSRWNMPV
ncbi:hypothetical protein D1BOALGB6SA_2516 [Olavius sp. associated proteobacterium Delta 1]|nr:hypothetical protein D1BOALGB6SA_2516 [Olavius sp. associated proteobacterium Delta 1]